jgi:GTPase SAR1 family protein
MAYPDTDVILLCFSVVRPDSMENIKTKWMPELNKYLPDALIVLVGTQVDLRESSLTNSNTDPRSRHITQREGEDLKQKIGAFRYIECSALTQLNIKVLTKNCCFSKMNHI